MSETSPNPEMDEIVRGYVITDKDGTVMSETGFWEPNHLQFKHTKPYVHTLQHFAAILAKHDGWGMFLGREHPQHAYPATFNPITQEIKINKEEDLDLAGLKNAVRPEFIKALEKLKKIGAK